MFGLLKVSQGKLTTVCINFLIESDQAESLAQQFQQPPVRRDVEAARNAVLNAVKSRNFETAQSGEKIVFRNRALV